MKKIYIFLPIFLIFIILFSLIAPAVNMSEDISTKVFRLHIIANSNSGEDQALKLKVRDEILSLSDSIYSECKSVESAISATERNIASITEAADKVIKENNYDYATRVIVTKEYFSTREYDGFTLPAGIYNCLKIVIGQGKGKNWWCVMFPQVCLSGCTDDFEPYLSEEEREMLTSGGYSVKFKIVEVYERFKSKILII